MPQLVLNEGQMRLRQDQSASELKFRLAPPSGSDFYSYDSYEDDQTVAASGDGDQCCALVVDPICLFAVIALIAGFAIFLERVINIEIMMGGRAFTPMKRGINENRRYYSGN